MACPFSLAYSLTDPPRLARSPPCLANSTANSNHPSPPRSISSPPLTAYLATRPSARPACLPCQPATTQLARVSNSHPPPKTSSMRESNSSNVALQRACVCVSSSLYDRRGEWRFEGLGGWVMGSISPRPSGLWPGWPGARLGHSTHNKQTSTFHHYSLLASVHQMLSTIRVEAVGATRAQGGQAGLEGEGIGE